MKYHSKVVKSIYQEEVDRNQVRNFANEQDICLSDMDDLDSQDKKYTWRFNELVKSVNEEGEKNRFKATLFIVESLSPIRIISKTSGIFILLSKKCLINYSLHESTTLIKHELMHFILNHRR